jgi:hypothetical protein
MFYYVYIQLYRLPISHLTEGSARVVAAAQVSELIPVLGVAVHLTVHAPLYLAIRS